MSFSKDNLIILKDIKPNELLALEDDPLKDLKRSGLMIKSSCLSL